MEILKNANRYDKWITMIVCILAMIIPLHNTPLSVWSLMGKGASVLLIGMSGLYILWHGIDKENNPSCIRYGIWGYIGLMGVLVVSGIIRGGMAGAIVAIKIGMVTCVGVACALIDWRQLGKRILVLDIGMLIWIYFMVKELIRWNKTNEYEWINYQFIYENSNTFGLIVLFLIMILALAYSQNRGERYILYIAILLPILLESNSRTVVIALMAALGMYMIWNISSRWEVSHWIVWILLISGLVSITYIYPRLGQWEGANALGKLVGELSNKRLFSGREKLWLEATEVIKQQPVMGYGLQATLQQFNEGALNTHNQYLQIVLQGGLIGLGLVLGLFTMIWQRLKQTKENHTVRIGAGIVVALLIVACFENTLFGESIPMGILEWGILGIGMSGVITGERL